MTTKTDFTEEEWDQLLQSPIQVGFYIIFADPGFTGMFREFKALFNAIFEQPVPDAASELVNSLMVDIEDKSKNREELPGSDDLPKGQPEDEMAKMLRIIEDVAVLLETKASSEEAADFKEWLFGVGKAVSEAAKEGGHFGFGGERVSKKEKYALKKLQFSLRM